MGQQGKTIQLQGALKKKVSRFKALAELGRLKEFSKIVAFCDAIRNYCSVILIVKHPMKVDNSLEPAFCLHGNSMKFAQFLPGEFPVDRI